MAKIETPFEKLIPLEEFIPIVSELLRRPPFRKRTLYKWLASGMPHEKIRGRVYVPVEKATLWLRRS